MSLDPRVSQALTQSEATRACESAADLVYIEHVPSGYRMLRTRASAESMLPEEFRIADGPDDIDDEKQPWALFDDVGNIIDTSGSLDDPAERLTDADRARVLAYRASTTEKQRKARRAALFRSFRQRSVA